MSGPGTQNLQKKQGKQWMRCSQAVLDNGWDGEWFLRAYDAQSEKVGSKECEEGKIFIEPQGFCVMAGIGKEEGIAEKALDSVNELLGNKVWNNDPSAGLYKIPSGTWGNYFLSAWI